ncbi:MAG: helix-turn-helix transcriptional regulator [Clostridiales bacterium]|nr:helix-turn-helix transcriptional regulator [Clostridiales bacterium]
MVNIDKIKSLAKEKGISIAFICSKIGQQRGYLNDVKQGKTSIAPDRLQIIADILNTTPEYLKDETDIKEKPVHAEMDEPGQDLIVVHRNGQRIVYHITDEKLKALEPLLKELEANSDDIDL